MASQKLVVEVVRADDLPPASCIGVFVELHFQGEFLRTTTKEGTVNPTWNERFSFDVSDPERLADLSLEAHIYNERTSSFRKHIILGKVRLEGTRFVRSDKALAEGYTLKKPGMLSWRGKGKLALLVFLEDVSRSSDEVKTDGQIIELRRSAQVPADPDFAVRSINPSLGGGRIVDGRLSPVGHKVAASSHQLVEVMWYIFVSVVKGRNLPGVSSLGTLDPYVEVNFGNYRVKTRHFQRELNPQWGVVFAFSNDHMQSSDVQVVLKSMDAVRGDSVGMVAFALHNVPTRVPPDADSALTPQWYKLMNQRIGTNGELMLSVWKGTQADEAFHDAWHSDSATPVHPSPISSELRSKVYSGPIMWVVSLEILRMEVVASPANPRLDTILVKSQIEGQILRTKLKPVERSNCSWRIEESFFFTVAEPFEENLILSVERAEGNRYGHAAIPLTSMDKRTDSREINPRWLNLQVDGTDVVRSDIAKVYLRVCLEGRYSVHVDGNLSFSSDRRSSADQLCSSRAIGLIELGILKAVALKPVKTRDRTRTVDPYCVVKYGRKWVRTRTILGSHDPRFNEQYAWDVYDPCTVLTIGVFDNSHTEDQSLDPSRSRHTRIGKVRIRLSTLEAGRVYALSYPLLLLNQNGLKKTGRLEVTIRFSCTSLLSMSRLYSRPLLPELHYTNPISIIHFHRLWSQSVRITAARLGLLEPPLRREVVEYICDNDCNMYSLRRAKSVFYRYVAVSSVFFNAWQLFTDMAKWKNPIITVLCHVLFLVALCYPHLLLPVIPSCLFLLVLWNRRQRPIYPDHVDASISWAEDAHPDELDEEFDTFPTSEQPEIVRMRYDRLRSIVGRIQTVARDLVVQLERAESMLSWRDPRATTMFALFCFGAAVALYIAPRVVAAAAGLYVMRHPRFRRDTPSALQNFFSRLPSKQDRVM